MDESNAKKILVTGAGGQLGQDFQMFGFVYPDFEFIYLQHADLDITNKEKVLQLFEQHKPSAVINCAAYTNVEKAEDDFENASLQNAEAPRYLAEACRQFDAVLVHFSTDYVFDGKGQKPYTENDLTAPLNKYGLSKLNGEDAIRNTWEKHYIFRVSWLYSTFGNNFLKTMIRLARERGELRVVADQKASPTYARHLAHDVLEILEKTICNNEQIPFGLYNYTNKGEASWFDFAREIVINTGLNVPVYPVATSEFPTKAVRPAYSKLDTSKFEKNTGIEIQSWKRALEDCLINYNQE